MKRLLTIVFVLTIFQNCIAQVDTAVNIDNSIVRYIYNPDTKSTNLSYDYSNRWDFDGDRINDSLLFIGNGGVHAYYYLRIVLSSDIKKRDFRLVQIDMPYLYTYDEFKKSDKNPAIQFVVNDFDNNSLPDIFINFSNLFGRISKIWYNEGIRTKYVILSFKKGKLSVIDYD